MDKTKKNFNIIFIFIIFFGISVGYAVINKTLTITGNSEVFKNTWDIRISNIQVTDGSVESIDYPYYDYDTFSVNFSFNLDLPGDFYEFTFDVINYGTIDAMLESLLKTSGLTLEQEKYLTYTIEYQNGVKILPKQLVEKGSFVRFKVRVEYRTDITEDDLPTTDETLNLTFFLNYVQSDKNGIHVENSGVLKVAPVASGSLENIGTIVTIGKESFFTIGSEGDNVKLLSMYNLDTGYTYNSSNDVVIYSRGGGTGVQASNRLGYVIDGISFYGVIPFSKDGTKGVNYSDYVGSFIEYYVDKYESLLFNYYGVVPVETRLITKEELTDTNTFACIESEKYCSTRVYPWIFSTSYWTGTSFDNNSIWHVLSDGTFDVANYSEYTKLGVRPVVVMDKDEIIIK